MASNDEWHDAVLALADRYYEGGHKVEQRAVAYGKAGSRAEEHEWGRAEVYHQAYADLCGLVARVDPRPGAGVARPW